MEFQLANKEDKSAITPDSSDEAANQNPSNQEGCSTKSSNSELNEGVTESDYMDSPYIADHYPKKEPLTDSPDTGSATILTQSNSFFPLLAYIGMGLYIIALIYALITISNGGSTNSMWFTMSKLVGLGGIFCIVDAIIAVCKHCGDWFLVLWAWLFPPVYLFKRSEANGDSQIIPIVIVGIEIFLVILIGIFSIGGKGQKNAEKGQLMLEFSIVSIDGTYYTCSDLIAYNISEPTYKYKAATASDPEYLILKGNTTIRGYSETIEIYWNYGTMKMVCINLGADTYQENAMGDILVRMAKNIPSSN